MPRTRHTHRFASGVFRFVWATGHSRRSGVGLWGWAGLALFKEQWAPSTPTPQHQSNPRTPRTDHHRHSWPTLCALALWLGLLAQASMGFAGASGRTGRTQGKGLRGTTRGPRTTSRSGRQEGSGIRFRWIGKQAARGAHALTKAPRLRSQSPAGWKTGGFRDQVRVGTQTGGARAGEMPPPRPHSLGNMRSAQP